MTQFVIGFTYTVLSTAVYSCKFPKISWLRNINS